jgi:hypothetical protein
VDPDDISDDEVDADDGEGVELGEVICAYCQCDMDDAEEATQCPGCQAIYHDDCWEENEGCAVYGCEHVPDVEKLSDVEVPVSYWGQEEKPCPVCGKEIKAAAVRCRHCGADFATAMPLDEGRYRDQILSKNRIPRMKIISIIIFILCLIPCTVPIGFVWGAIYLLLHRKHMREFPTFHKMLIILGLAVDFVAIGIMTVFGLFHFVLSFF